VAAVDWESHAGRERARYAEAISRLPDDPGARQKHLVRAAMAAGGAGLACLLQGRRSQAARWFARSAEHYRESYAEAPPESWGRVIGAVKARVLADDWTGAEVDARWALETIAAASESTIGRYGAVLALLVLGRDEDAATVAESLREESFPRPVADALVALAVRDRSGYERAARAVLASFESREAFLADVPVADTVIVLEALAERRGSAARLASPMLPRPDVAHPSG
jgi:hypothetical protein